MTEVIVKLTGSGDWEVPAGVTELADVVVVAGGGGGGSRQGGGGGAGGVLHLTDVAVTPEELIAYSVGLGGEGGTSGGNGTQGENTSFGASTAQGGGRGRGGSDWGDGGDGGSGGGGAPAPDNSGAGSGGIGTAEQGNNGGASTVSGNNAGGGGGGASSVGANATASTGGNGGAGSDLSAIFGVDHGDSGFFGGGGGGGTFGGSTSSPGGIGGGGRGGNENAPAVQNGEAGKAETGGGGGGSWATGAPGGAGGSGVILIRYVLPEPGTETGTGSQPQLTPMNLFLVSITLPDEPFEEPEPEPAIPDGGLTLSGSVQIPSDTQTGDLIMIFGFHRGSDIQLPSDFVLDYTHYRLGSGSTGAQTEFVFSKIANSSDASREVNLSQFGVAVGNELVALRMQAFALVLRSSQPSYEVSILDRFDSLSHPSFNIAETGHLIGFCNAILGSSTSQDITVSVSGSWPNPPVVGPTPTIRVNCVTQPSPVTDDAYSWSASPTPWDEARNGHILVTSNGNAIDFVSSSAALTLVSSAP